MINVSLHVAHRLIGLTITPKIVTQDLLHFYIVHIPHGIELHCATSPCSDVCRWLMIDHCRMPHALDVVLCVRCMHCTIRGDLM